MQPLLGLLVIAVAVYAIFRKADVRIALGLAAVALGAGAGLSPHFPGQTDFRLWTPEGMAASGRGVMAVLRMFLVTFSNEKFVIPICCAMGFAHVLRLTGCDQHLVHLLVQPLQRIRFFLVPGTVLVGFCVNMPVISQTSTAVAIGSVLVPLLLAARISPLTTGAALLLGSSLGGELLNPGAPELRTIAQEMQKRDIRLDGQPVESSAIVEHVFPLIMVHLAVATAVFWLLSVRAEAAKSKSEPAATEDEAAGEPFRVHYLKAAVPLLPLALLFLAGPPFDVLDIPRSWLVRKVDDPSAFDSRLIGAAMLIGVVAAAASTPRVAPQAAKAFFEGAGYAFGHIISLIVIATTFAEGIVQVGLAVPLQQAIGGSAEMLIVSAAALPLAFAWLCGSGMATTQGLYEFFVPPTLNWSLDPARIGALVSIAAAAGRTMSPVAAVVLMCASLTNRSPLELIRRVAVPLLVGVAVMTAVALVWFGDP